MGGGFVFTGENDADIMHNSVTINLNVLEGVRQLNETFDGVEKEYTTCNRPKLDQPTKIFYSGSACRSEHNQLNPDNPDCREESKDTRFHPIPSMVGGSSVNVSILLTIVTMAFLLGVAGIITSLVQKEPGQVEERAGSNRRKVAYLPNDGG